MDCTVVLTAMNAAKAHVLKPKLQFNELIISAAPDTGANPGHLYVKSRPGSIYLGKITPDGRFFPSRVCTIDDIALLERIMKNPLEEAKLYGREYGICSCCGKTLTNSISVKLGIGPVCRAYYGWGYTPSDVLNLKEQTLEKL